MEGVCALFGRKVGEYSFNNIYICIGYILPTIGGLMSVGGCVCALWHIGIHFVIYIHLYWVYTANNWGIYVSCRMSMWFSGTGLGNIHTFVLDIYFQQLGDICQFQSVCAPFGPRVWQYTFCNTYICIGYTANNLRICQLRKGNIHFVRYTLVLDIYCHQLGDICQLEGVSAPFVLGFGEYAFCNLYTCIGYLLPAIGGCL